MGLIFETLAISPTEKFMNLRFYKRANVHVDALWDTLHMNAQSPKTSMNVRSVKVYDDVRSRSMTRTTNTKIMK